uniref:Uncharacterized protein n=1 Tax=Magallana gigas TaxID=29159 RepID=A0A8W8MMD6_MAGGI
MTGVVVTTLCGGEGRKASLSNCSPICVERASNPSNDSADFVKSLNIREKNVVSASKARWVIKKQSAQISEEHNNANAGTCNATSSLSLILPDLNNIVADEEVDDVNADTDDSDDCDSKHSSMPWDSGRRVVELGVLANALASCKN